MAKAQDGGQRVGGKDFPGGAVIPDKYRRQLDTSERPRDPAGLNKDFSPNLGRFTVPHVITFSGISTSLSKAYRNHDQAMRHSVENAHMMLSDPAIRFPLLARQTMTSLLQWGVESEDDKDPKLQVVSAELKKIVERTPRFTELRCALLEAIWYGRYATQQAFGFHTNRFGQRRRVIRHWEPVSGDKLLFRYNDGSYEYDPNQIGVKVSPAMGKDDLIGGRRRLEPTGEGMGYFLEPWERRHWCVHKHMIRDGEYEDPISAGQIHGVGLRHFLYWVWFQKQETLAQLAEVIDRTGAGITIYYYPIGNQEAKSQVEKVAREQAHTNVLVMPYDIGAGGADYSIQQIPPNTAGMQALQDLITQYFEDMIIRSILGQTLSSKPDATGLGSSVADLQKDSLFQIVRYDAVNLEETLTKELLLPLRDFNFPSYRNVDFFFKISTKVSAPQEELAAIYQAWQMGAKIRQSDIFEKLDMSMPDDDDKVVYNPQIVQAIEQIENPQPMGSLPPGGAGPQPPGAASLTPQAGGDQEDENTSGNQNERPISGENIGENGDSQQLALEKDGDDGEKKRLFGPILYSRGSLSEAIELAAKETDTNPSPEQRRQGNYRKGRCWVRGVEIAIENAKGTKRKPEWEPLACHYGYVSRHSDSGAVSAPDGKDGDKLDVYLGPDPDSEIVFVIDQPTKEGKFDEHKTVLFTRSEREARELYLSNYPAGWKCGAITALTWPQFRSFLTSGDPTKPLYKQVLRYGKQMSFTFDEKEHPRAEDGKFTDKEGGESKPASQEEDKPNVSKACEAKNQGAKRSRTSVHFDKPIVGPSGAKLTAYDWKWMLEEGPEHDDPVRVSDWSEAATSEHTGRDVVHHFHVTHEGSPKIVSLESALKLLGFDDGSEGMAKVKNLAMASMQLAEQERAHEELEATPADKQSSSHKYAVDRSQEKIDHLKQRIKSLAKEAERAASGQSPAEHYRDTFGKAMQLRNLFHTNAHGELWQNDFVDNLSKLAAKSDHQERGRIYEEGRAAYRALLRATRHNILGERTSKTPVHEEIPERKIFGHTVKAVPAWTDAKMRNWYFEHGEDTEAAIEQARQWLEKYHPKFNADEADKYAKRKPDPRQKPLFGDDSPSDSEFETKHPRGQPENAGEFVAKGQGTKTSPKSEPASEAEGTSEDAKEGAEKEKAYDPISDWKENGIRSQSFKKWFGDWEQDPDNSSKVVNPETGEPQETSSIPGTGSKVMREGKPVTVYHGTSFGQFPAFEKKWGTATGGGSGENLLYGPGMYFTESEKIATEYSTIRQVGFNGDMEGLRKEAAKAAMWISSQADSDPHYKKVAPKVMAAADRIQEMTLEQVENPSGEDLEAIGQLKTWMPTSVVESLWENQSRPHVFNVYLNIRKPFDVDESAEPITSDDAKSIADLMLSGKWKEIGQKGKLQASVEKMATYFASEPDYPIRASFVYSELSGFFGKSGANEILQAAGYDGITHIGGNIMGGGHTHRVWIAFEPNQIKSTDNQGTFDPADERMKYAKSESPADYFTPEDDAPTTSITRLKSRLQYAKELSLFEAEPQVYACSCAQKYQADTEDFNLHSLGHIGDKEYGVVSASPEWLSAWESEIATDDKPLSSFAATDPQEGFAEYTRLVLSEPEVAQEQFPGAWEVLASNGLVD